MATESDGKPGLPGFWQRLWRAPASAWISPRRKRFWLVVAVALYTLVGFLLVPWVVKTQLEARLSAALERPVTVQVVRFNPYVLSLEAVDFRIGQPNATPLAAFDRLFVNVQSSSLFRRALTFAEVTLEKPFVDFVRFDDGTTNLQTLLAESAADGEDEPAQSSLLRLVVHELKVSSGIVRVEDRVPKTPFVEEVGPVDIQVSGFSTLPDARGNQQVRIATPSGAILEASGELQVNPLAVDGRVHGEGPYLPMLYRWTQDRVTFKVEEGNASMSLDYHIEMPGGGDVTVRVENLEFDLSGVVVVDEAGRQFLDLPDNHLSGGMFLWPEKRLGAERLALAGAHLDAWRDESGVLSLSRLIAPSDTAAEEEPVEENAPLTPVDDWEMALGELAVTDFSASFVDHSVRTPAPIEVADLDVRLNDLSNSPGARFPFDVALGLATGGNVMAGGGVTVVPAPAIEAEMKVENLALAVVQPYLGDVMRVVVDEGNLGVDAVLSMGPETPLTLSGSLAVDALSLSDAEKGERLVGWRRLAVDQFAVDGGKPAIEISEVVIEAPFTRLLIDSDRSTNFQQLTIGADEGEAPVEPEPDTPPTAPPAISVARISVSDGAIDFADRALPLPFAAKVSEFAGNMTGLSTVSAEPAGLKFSGRVADYGLARVEGSVSLMSAVDDTDVGVFFKNVALPDLDPYTVKFAGRRMADGRLDLNLRYRLKEGHIEGENNIVVNRLELGEKVEQSGAMDLPLDLAVALLKGPDGKIDLDIPVSGDVNDPTFKLGGAVAKAFRNIIAGIATAPFRLLAGLVGASSEEFSKIEFEAGASALTPPEREKLDKLAEALALRPNLSLTVAGPVDETVDGPALARGRVDERVEAGLAETKESDMLNVRRRQALESLITSTLPETDLAAVRAANQRSEDPAAPEGKTVLDEPAYLKALQAILVDAEPIGEADFDALAAERSAAVRKALEDNAVDSARISVAPRRAAKARGDWIAMELGVRGKGR